YESLVTQSYARNADRIIALYVLMCATAAWCAAYQIDFFGALTTGGIVGICVYKTLYTLFDSMGALLCIYTLILICLLIITRLSLIRCIYYCISLGNQAFRTILYSQPYVQKMYVQVHAACSGMTQTATQKT